MNSFAEQILRSRGRLIRAFPQGPVRKEAEEGGCGVVGFAASVPVAGRHIFQPSIQMHNRGNGKGGGIAAAGLDPAFLGVSRTVLDECYLIQVALLDKTVLPDLEKRHILSCFDVQHAADLSTAGDYRAFGLLVRPPDVRRYFVRVKPAALKAFSAQFAGAAQRQIEDEFVFQNSFRINQAYYASLGEKKAFVLSHGRDLMILKIVGYAEEVVKYYGISDMPAHAWIAHQRYPTKGRVWHPGGAHPFAGMNEALVHNGDFANYHSVCEYLKQRNLAPQFLTDTEVSALTFDLWHRVYRYPLEYVIEGLAPTTEFDFDRLPPEKRGVYGAIQRSHIHGSPDGPWFFIIAQSDPDARETRLIGITDTAMLRPQVFALYDGEVQIGLCASEKQAIDATLKSLSAEDPRFRSVADRYWNARGGSATDGGAFIFTVRRGDGKASLSCANKFGEAVKVDAHKSPSNTAEDFSKSGTPEAEKEIRDLVAGGRVQDLAALFTKNTAKWDFNEFRWRLWTLVRAGGNGHMDHALEALTLIYDRKFYLGLKKRSFLREAVMAGIEALFDSVPLLKSGSAPSAYRRVTRETQGDLRPPRDGEKVLVIDAQGFPPEGEGCDANLIVRARHAGWKRFMAFRLCGQRFHGCGLGRDSGGVRIDLYGSPGDYAGSGMYGCELYIHGDGQDQLGQILKAGKLVVYGSVGQTFLYGAKGGSVFVMGDAAGRPLINAVGAPRVVINGTCLDFLAESFMAGDPLNGGGFAVVNGIRYENGIWRNLPSPYPGGNLFSLASGGALYVRDPMQVLVKDQLNGGSFVDFTDRDWALIRPYLEENEALFDIKTADLLSWEGKALPPEKVFRKIAPIQLTVLSRELTVEGE